MYNGAAGGAVAGPIWKEFMKEALKNKPHPEFKQFPRFSPKKIMLNGDYAQKKKVKIDSISGKLATKNTPKSLIEEKTFKTAHTILHYVDKNNPRGPIPEPPSTKNSQYKNWEKSVKQWIQENKSEFNKSPPTKKDDIHIPKNKPSVEFIEPEQEDKLSNRTIEIKLDPEGKLELKQIDLFVDNNYLQTIDSSPWETTINLSTSSGYCKDSYKLRARVYDQALNFSENSIDIETDFECPTDKGGESATSSKEIKVTLESEKKDKKRTLTVTPENIPGQIKKIRLFYYRADSPTKINLISENESVSESSSYSFTWKESLEPGYYHLYAQVTDEKLNIYKSNELKIQVSEE